MKTERQMRVPDHLVPAVAGTTIEHEANGRLVTSKITFKDLSVGDTGDNASKAIGVKVFESPVNVAFFGVYMNVTLTHADTVKTDTPDVGLGTVVASGAVAVLGGTATFENILTGQTATNVAGTHPVIASGVSGARGKTCFLNVADGWANVTATGLTATGEITLVWLLGGDS